MWFTIGVTGLSAQAICGDGNHRPWDPSDLRRCVDYCRSSSLSTADLRKRMAGRSAEWDLLLAEWDNLVDLLHHEMDTRDDFMAPRTYIEMKRVLADGVTCEACEATGRGESCAKCKGTGKRGGGRCRADDCHRGAALCPTCRGRGFTTNQKAA